MEIFEKIKNASDGKERQKILEDFRTKKNKSDKENVRIIGEGERLLEEGEDRDIIIALQVMSRAQGFPLSGQLKEILQLSGKEKERVYRKTISYDELMEIVERCLKLLTVDNGNVRIASANCLNALGIYSENFDYVDLFHNLLLLKNFYETKDNNKIKSIVFCLDKIWCLYLENLIENFSSLETKNMRITNKGKVTKNSKELENFVNKMIKETESYIKNVLTLRGERFFIDTLVPYTENMRIIQVLYEYEKILELVEKRNIKKDLLKRYINTRLKLILRRLLEDFERVENKGYWVCVVIGIDKSEVGLSNIQSVYNELKYIERDIETNFLVNF